MQLELVDSGFRLRRTSARQGLRVERTASGVWGGRASALPVVGARRDENLAKLNQIKVDQGENNLKNERAQAEMEAVRRSAALADGVTGWQVLQTTINSHRFPSIPRFFEPKKIYASLMGHQIPDGSSLEIKFINH